MLKKFLNAQTKSVSFASLILAGSYLLSALLGVLRDHLLTGRIATAKLDVYYAAFNIPDFIGLILIFGAIAAAIVPIFSGYLIESDEKAWHYVNNLLNIFLSILIVVSVILIIFAPFVVSIIVPGFSPEKRELTVTLMRIMFLSPIILGISAIISGILQVFHRFLVTALAPIMYNIGIVIGILFFLPAFGLKGLAYGVILGGVLHLLIQIPAFLHSGFKYKLTFDIKDLGVQKTLTLMAPRSLGLGAGQLDDIIITGIASTLISGTIAIFTLTNTLSALLVNAIAVSLSTAIFPKMSLANSQGDKKGFEYKFSAAFGQIMFLSVPISISIFLLRAQISRVVWGSGQFNWTDTRLAAACLGIFAIGLYGQGLIFLLSKTFYAVHNTKIPAWISAGTVAFNIALTLLFLQWLSFSNIFSDFLHWSLKMQDIHNISVVGLALAFTLTAICESSLLLFFVYKELHIFRLKAVLPSLYKIAISGIIMGVVMFLVREGLVNYNLVNLQTTLGVFLQGFFAGTAGIIVYIAAAFLLKCNEMKVIKESFFKKFNAKKING